MATGSDSELFRSAAELFSWDSPHFARRNAGRRRCVRSRSCTRTSVVIEELMPNECRAIISRATHAHLACSLNNQPYIVPIHVDLDGSFLYGYSTLGQKITWMRENPLVCVEVDEVTTHTEWATVVVYGVYEELPKTSEFAYPRFVAENLFQKRPRWWEPAAVPLTGRQRRSPILFRIIISRMTGRRARYEAVAAPCSQPKEPARLTWLTGVLRRCRGDRPRSEHRSRAARHSSE